MEIQRRKFAIPVIDEKFAELEQQLQAQREETQKHLSALSGAIVKYEADCTSLERQLEEFVTEINQLYMQIDTLQATVTRLEQELVKRSAPVSDEEIEPFGYMPTMRAKFNEIIQSRATQEQPK